LTSGWPKRQQPQTRQVAAVVFCAIQKKGSALGAAAWVAKAAGNGQGKPMVFPRVGQYQRF
jgi:hypothetical protein